MERGSRACAHAVWLRTVGAVVLGLALASGSAIGHPELGVVQGAVDEMVTAHPNDSGLLVRQARLREKSGDWDGALVSLAHALEHGADPTDIAAERGHVFLAASFPGMAKLEYDAVLAKRPDAYAALFERGRALLQLGRPEEADRDFAAAIAGLARPRPEHVLIRQDALLARGKTDEAIQALDQGIARLGPLPSLEIPAIDLEVQRQRYASALQRIDIVLKQAPTNSAWIVRRAEILRSAGRPAEARAELERALTQIESKPAHRRNRSAIELAARLRQELSAAENNGGKP